MHTERLATILLANTMAVCLCLSSALRSTAAEPQAALPAWFEEHRVQAHFENNIENDAAGLYEQLHPAISSMGARVLTRIFKTTSEGAWWPTAAGYTHEILAGRDLGREIADNAHRHGLKAIAYYRVMCDDFVENEHPEWLCRDLSGNLVLEPRTRRRTNERDRKHIICFNSPARQLIQTRLLELADRGVDGIYFDSWHMPEVCVCGNCQAAFARQTGKAMEIKAPRGSAEYLANARFTAQTIVETFVEWKAAVKARHPRVIFAISSSLYPCFDSQMQITGSLLKVSDTSKTEFAKPFGGFLGWPAGDGAKLPVRGRPYMDESFALPEYDVQNGLGWSLTRDSSDGRPPLMWIPFTQTTEEAMFSTAAAVTYGMVASIHPVGLSARRSPSIEASAIEVYKPCYALGEKVSPYLASARPLRTVLIHVSEQSRNTRIADARALWVDLFAPALGAFEALQQAHLPVATINDLELSRGVPAETQVLILPHADELTPAQRSALDAFAARGTVLPLGDDGWHLKTAKPALKQKLLAQVEAALNPSPICAHGPAAMHAVFYRGAMPGRTVACLVNDFGWYRSELAADPSHRQAAPPPCRGVVLELPASAATHGPAIDVLSGTALPLRRVGDKTTIELPPFAVMACVAIEPPMTND